MERNLTNDEIKFLKKIEKGSIIINNASKKEFYAKEALFHDNLLPLKKVNMKNVDFDYLRDNKYLDFEFKYINSKFAIVILTPKGKLAIEKTNTQLKQFWTPVLISIAALVVSIISILVSALV